MKSTTSRDELQSSVSISARSTSTDQPVGRILYDLTRQSTGTPDTGSSFIRSDTSTRKRKRSVLDEAPDASQFEHDEVAPSRKVIRLSSRSQERAFLTGLRLPFFIFPKSQYHGWQPPLDVSPEESVLREFRDAQARAEQDDRVRGARRGSTPPSAGGDEYQSFELDNFSIYKPDQGLHPNELAPLHHLCAKSGNQDYLFDGILREGSMERYVERVPFKLLSIGNHCDTEHHTVGDQTWVQSSLVQRRGLDVWYQLGKPAPEYRHYHEQFLWLANFAKHFTDYLQRHDGVRLHHFRRQFYDEIMVLHQEHDAFRDWLDEYDDTDFRRVITANFEFLWKEAVDVERLNANQPLWNEVHSKDLRAVKAQKGPEERTVVTPFVYQCFKNMKWGEYLKVMKPSRKVFEARRAREEALSLTVDSREGGLLAPREESPEIEYVGHESKGEDSAGPPHDGRFISLSTFFDEHDLGHEAREKGERMRARAAMARENFLGCVIPRATRVPRDEFGNILVGRPRRISVGDVVGVDKDSKTVWKGSADLWYAYVQGVTTTGSGRNYLSVLWLYEPSDTTCSTMTYPIHNELFFSDNCNCGDDKLALEDVACRVSVAFFSTPGNSGAECFVRQKYRTQDAAFVTLQEGDFICVHRREHVESELEVAQNKAKLGSTLLYLSNRSPGRRILEPGEVVANGAMDGKYVLIRRLVRRHRDFPGEDASPPNELVYTDEIIPVRLEDLDRTCLVRFFTEQERQDRQIPPPYNRNGTGDAFYITCRQVANGSTRHLVPLTLPFPKTMVQGFDPRAPSARPVLNGMDLYCGGGNFGRGLEEGRAVHNKWAVDYDKDAIHTYHANLDDPAGTALYYGSVNNFLAQGLKGRFSEHVPAPGEVDFISAGSPCQGFSNANQKKSDPKSLRNSSLVASVAAYVDYYRPKYALLENVLSMAAKGPKNQEHNVFSQLLCSLVGMGYQVQQFNLDAWSFGSPQSRSRLFVSIAAPGLQLPPHPALSHSHPASKGDRGLGVASNGVAFGLRRFEATPFEYVTAHEGTCDLPWIGDGRTQTCIPHPDHRTSRFESDLKRVQISQIPVMPRGQSFMKAYKRGRLGRPQIDDFAWENRHKVTKISKSWRRVDPNGLMPTVVTNAQPSCSFTGTVLHWEQHRLLTVMEVRRAQGFPDHEVLVGHPRVQWKIVGNSVARTVALALGLSLREAWLAQAPPELDPAQVEVTDAQSATARSRRAESTEQAQPMQSSSCFSAVCAPPSPFALSDGEETDTTRPGQQISISSKDASTTAASTADAQEGDLSSSCASPLTLGSLAEADEMRDVAMSVPSSSPTLSSPLTEANSVQDAVMSAYSSSLAVLSTGPTVTVKEVIVLD